MSVVLPGLVDRKLSESKWKGEVVILSALSWGSKKKVLAYVYGESPEEMRRNKHGVAAYLRDQYSEWPTPKELKRKNMTYAMLHALRVLRVLGKVVFANVVCKSTRQALFRRKLIDSALDFTIPKAAAERGGEEGR